MGSRTLTFWFLRRLKLQLLSLAMYGIVELGESSSGPLQHTG